MVAKYVAVEIGLAVWGFQVHGPGLSVKILDEGNFVCDGGGGGPPGEAINGHVVGHPFQEGVPVLETCCTASLLLH